MKINHLALSNIEDDLLNSKEKAEKIAKFINQYRSDVPYAISVNGSWGTGKSTVLNFIEYYLDKHRCEVIRFNPWIITDNEQLLYLLFEEIYDCIDGGYTKAKDKFFDYAQKLSKPVSKIAGYFGQVLNGVPHQVANPASDAASEIVSQISKDFFNKPLSKRKKELEEELKVMFSDNNRKIVIMIDEIDRMFPEEVVKIFQMIKSVLDLPGIFFVVAMDPDVINDSLLGIGIKRPSEYLQKIFQKNYSINSNFQLRTLSYKILLPSLKESKYFKEIQYLISTFINLNEDNFITLEIDNNEINEKNIKDKQKEIQQSYYNLYGKFREQFENPREFIKLSEYVIENWETFYQEIMDGISDNKKHLQMAFLIFLIHFKFPNEMVPNFMYNDKISSDFVKVIKKHIKLTYPQQKGEKTEEGFIQMIDPYSEIVDKCMKVLFNFPDYKKYDDSIV